MAQKGAFLGYNALLGDGSYVENRPSKWQRTLGILNEYNPIPAFERLMKSPMASGGPISEQNISDGLTVAGTVTGGSSLFPKPRNAVNMGIRAFHGSPHSFPPVRLIEMADGTRLYQNMHELPDTPQGAKIIQEFPLGRFDMSKIGTGEGAQAYGHGLYFAELEGIARSYRDALSAAKRPLVPEDPVLLEKIKTNNKRADYLSEQQQYASSQAEFDDIANKIAAIEDENKSLLGTKGHMYEVNINADPNAFLDWDKPLSEQPDVVRRALEANLPEYKIRNIAGVPHVFANNRMIEVNDPSLTGRDAYILSRMGQPGDLTREQAASASSALREAGIPGIKYLDAGSRGAGDGTRNYVVFDDKLIEIVRKYGIAGLLGMSAAGNAMLDQPQEKY